MGTVVGFLLVAVVFSLSGYAIGYCRGIKIASEIVYGEKPE